MPNTFCKKTWTEETYFNTNLFICSPDTANIDNLSQNFAYSQSLASNCSTCEPQLYWPGFPINILVVGGRAPSVGDRVNQQLVEGAVYISSCQHTNI